MGRRQAQKASLSPACGSLQKAGGSRQLRGGPTNHPCALPPGLASLQAATELEDDEQVGMWL